MRLLPPWKARTRSTECHRRSTTMSTKLWNAMPDTRRPRPMKGLRMTSQMPDRKQNQEEAGRELC